MFDALQLIGGIILAVGYIPQIVKILRTRSVKDFAFRTYLLLFLGISCMEAYAIRLVLDGSGGMFLITNTISMAITGVMCLIIWHFQRIARTVIAPFVESSTSKGDVNNKNRKGQYTATLSDRTTYEGIDADSKDEAIEIALSWWDERMPDIKIKEKTR